MFDDEVHLFIFRRQGVSRRFAAADRDVPVVGGHTYVAAQIERDAIKQSAERAKDKLKIRMAYSTATTPPPNGWEPTQSVGNWWRPHIPSDPITVICLTHDPASGDPPAIEWTGWALQPVFDGAQLELTCTPNPPSSSAINQGSKWQVGCFKTVYSTGPRGCNLVAGPHTLSAELASVAGTSITAGAFSAPPLPWVRVEWLDGEALRSAAVLDDSGGTLTLAHTTGLEAGSEVTAYTAPQFTIDSVLDAVNGLTLTAPEFVGTPFTLSQGWLEWTRDDGLVESRPIMAHNNTLGTVTILWSGEGLAPGRAVAATPNCPGTWAACAARRSDPQNHYGGAIYKPVRDPIAEGIPMSWG